MVGENGCPYRHHGALYDDVISTYPFKFLLANQKARFTNSANQSTLPIFVGEGVGAEISTLH